MYFFLFTSTIAPFVVADELEQLKIQLAELSRKVELLEQKQLAEKQAPPPENAVVAGEARGSWKLPGSQTSMRIDGFVRAHMIYDRGPRPTSAGGDVASIHTAILENTPEYENRGDVRIAGRDARFNITPWTPTELGRMYTFIQGDFKGDPDNKGSRATTSRSSFSLRHAYAEIGNFLMGQTYSAFMDNSVFGDKVDPTGPTGRTMIRQGQLRYTHRFDGDRRFAIAIENPYGDFVDANDKNLDDGLSDLTMHYRHQTDRWAYQFSGMVRRIGIDDGMGIEDTAMSWGLNHSGMYMFPTNRDRITWYINLGEGIGRYLEGGKDQAASLSTEGKLDTQFGYGGFITYKHWWTNTLSSNLDFGMGYYKLNSGADSEDNKKLFSSHLNLIWAPIDIFELGIEYVWGHRQVYDGRKGAVNRIMVNSVFNF